ncbi:MFS quinate transporter [Colletotrichum plurivorum]|uniref:MFS quinate transporter n=1 Tax=Colletotrichum plurivorum TaxID=2175906 RepID=A0A8H6KFA7_9PEZI|nr:MFS quinate transporter [Colletotrichum plurivorum]
MEAFSETSLSKYVRAVKGLPSEIFNWDLFVTVIGFALEGTPKVGPMAIAELAPKTVRGLMTLWFNVCMLGGQALGIFTVFGCNQSIPANKSLQYQIPWFAQVFIPVIAAVDTGYWAIMKEKFTVRSNLRRVQLTIIAYILAQFSGANSITNLLPTVLGLIGVQGSDVKVYSTGLYAVAKLVCCVIASLVFVDVVGRRKSLMIGITIQAMCHEYLAGYLRYFVPNPEGMPAGASDVAIGVIYIHALGWAVGLYTLPYLFGAELWPNRIRSFGGALSQCCHWLFYFGITKVTPSLLSAMDTWGAFLFFVAWCIIAFLYTLFFVPETSGLNLKGMEAIFQRPMYRMRQPSDKGVLEDGDGAVSWRKTLSQRLAR